MTDVLPTYRIGVIPGDGIGPEVISAALAVLEAAAAAERFRLELIHYDLGADRYLRTGEVLPDSVIGELASCDSTLLGAIGDPRVPPGVLERGLLLRLRQELDLYVNLRPARLFEGVGSCLAGVTPEDLDLVIVRENTESLYAGAGEVLRGGTDDEYATEVSINTAPAVERVMRFAFELASKPGVRGVAPLPEGAAHHTPEGANPRSQVRSLTLIHKTNVLQRAGGLWSRLFERLSGAFPDVPTAYQHVDAAALLLATEPRRFQVIVTDNLFGDILSDLTAALVGGIGLVGSGNIHPGRPSVFEPVHGTAPGIAGTGKANPIGAILSGALMLRHLGAGGGADRIEAAVDAVAGKIVRSRMTTREAGALIAEALA